jgi:hypothetical protein
MLPSMAYTQQDLDSIKSAIAAGELSVRFGDRQITYRSLDELIRIQNQIEAELYAAKPRLSPRHRIARFADE